MNKKLTRVLLAAILALSVTTVLLLPTITSVYAAAAPAAPGPAITAPAAAAPSETPTVNQDQTQVSQPPAPEPPKEGDNPHSGHH